MDFWEYQGKAMSLAVYPGRGSGSLIYPALGVAGEAGEVADKVKKVLRDDGGALSPEVKVALLKELGDVLWYITACADEMGYTLEDVADANIKKLTSRRDRGVLGGSGDER